MENGKERQKLGGRGKEKEKRRRKEKPIRRQKSKHSIAYRENEKWESSTKHNAGRKIHYIVFFG